VALAVEAETRESGLVRVPGLAEPAARGLVELAPEAGGIRAAVRELAEPGLGPAAEGVALAPEQGRELAQGLGQGQAGERPGAKVDPENGSLRRRCCVLEARALPELVDLVVLAANSALRKKTSARC